MTNLQNSAGDRALQKRKGMAIKGLKAHIKALELNDGVKVSEHKYRYEIAANGETARIYLNATGATVEHTERSLTDWADTGKPCRLALIGLRYTKDQLERDGDRVLYTLNVLTGEACLSRRGEKLTDHPTTIAGWAEIGKPIEKREFESLRVAMDYHNQEAAASVKANMIRWGIIRPAKDGQSGEAA